MSAKPEDRSVERRSNAHLIEVRDTRPGLIEPDRVSGALAKLLTTRRSEQRDGDSKRGLLFFLHFLLAFLLGGSLLALLLLAILLSLGSFSFSSRTRSSLGLRGIGCPCPLNHVNTGHNVAPLVTSTKLNTTSLGAVEYVEVVRLQELVRKLGEGDTGVRVETGLDPGCQFVPS